MRQYSNADQLVNYIEDGGFRDDLMSQLGLEDELDLDYMWDQALSRHER